MNVQRGIASIVTALAVALSFGIRTVSPHAQAASASPLWSVVTGHRTDPGVFHEPLGVATDSQGNVYVADSKNSRIQKVSRGGKVLAVWGSFGRGPGQFIAPVGVAVGAQGNVFVSDSGSDRIQQFSPQGQVLAVWGGHGLAPGHFRMPLSVAMDREGDLYVVDGRNHRVQKLSPSGKPLAQLGTFDFSTLQEGGLPGVAIDSSDNLYVADKGVREFSPSGRSLAYWARGTTFSAIAVDAQGNIYVADNTNLSNTAIQKFSPKHKLIAKWRYNAAWLSSDCVGEPQSAPAIKGISIDRQGRLYGAAPSDNRVHRFAPSGRELAPWGSCNRAAGSLQTPLSVAVDGHGNVYVGDTKNGRIQRFSPEGKPLAAWPRRSNERTAISAYGLALNARQNVIVANHEDNGSGGLIEFSPSGKRLHTWAVRGMGLALDGKGNMYTAEEGEDSIKKISPSGEVLAHWGSHGSGPGQFRFERDSAIGLAVDRSGSIYVTDAGNNRIQKLSRTGKPLAQWGHFTAPQGLALDARGNIYVADTGRDAIQEFFVDPTRGALVPLAQWGTTGIGPGDFQSPTGLAVDKQGNLYVADSGNDRIQKLSPSGNAPPTTTPTPSPTPITTPTPSTGEPDGATLWDESAEVMATVRQVHIEMKVSSSSAVADCDIVYPTRIRVRIQFPDTEIIVVEDGAWSRERSAGGTWGPWKPVRGDDGLVLAILVFGLCPPLAVSSNEDILSKDFSSHIDNLGTETLDGVAVWHLHAENQDKHPPATFDVYVAGSTRLWTRVRYSEGGTNPSLIDLYFSRYNQPVQIEPPSATSTSRPTRSGSRRGELSGMSLQRPGVLVGNAGHPRSRPAVRPGRYKRGLEALFRGLTELYRPLARGRKLLGAS